MRTSHLGAHTWEGHAEGIEETRRSRSHVLQGASRGVTRPAPEHKEGRPTPSQSPELVAAIGPPSEVPPQRGWLVVNGKRSPAGTHTGRLARNEVELEGVREDVCVMEIVRNAR